MLVRELELLKDGRNVEKLSIGLAEMDNSIFFVGEVDVFSILNLYFFNGLDV